MIYYYLLINFVVLRGTEGLVFTPDNFYTLVKAEYDRRPVSKESVSGIEDTSEKDINMSITFIQDILSGPDAPGNKIALDCGAGYGRVTKNILINFFDKVDLVEQNNKFADAAIEFIGKDCKQLGTLYRAPLQDFNPSRTYDLIWVQWILMYMTDEDSKSFLDRCRKALKPKGVIIIKENLAINSDTYYNQVNLVRNFNQIFSIIQEAGLVVIKYEIQYIKPNLYIPVHMFAVVPKEVEHLYSELRKEYSNENLQEKLEHFRNTVLVKYSNASKIKLCSNISVILCVVSVLYYS